MGFDVISDGRIKFSYRIISDASYLPQNLRSQISQQTGIPSTKLIGYQVSFVPSAKHKSVQLSIAGTKVAEEKFASDVVLTGGLKEGSFYPLGGSSELATKHATRSPARAYAAPPFRIL